MVSMKLSLLIAVAMLAAGCLNQARAPQGGNSLVTRVIYSCSWSDFQFGTHLFPKILPDLGASKAEWFELGIRDVGFVRQVLIMPSAAAPKRFRYEAPVWSCRASGEVISIDYVGVENLNSFRWVPLLALVESEKIRQEAERSGYSAKLLETSWITFRVKGKELESIITPFFLSMVTKERAPRPKPTKFPDEIRTTISFNP